MVSTSSAKMPASNHLQLCQGKAAGVYLPVVRVQKPSRFSAVWKEPLALLRSLSAPWTVPSLSLTEVPPGS